MYNNCVQKIIQQVIMLTEIKRQLYGVIRCEDAAVTSCAVLEINFIQMYMQPSIHLLFNSDRLDVFSRFPPIGEYVYTEKTFNVLIRRTYNFHKPFCSGKIGNDLRIPCNTKYSQVYLLEI